MHIALVLNGLAPAADTRLFDFVVCADGGACQGIEPNLVVGDGDSFDGPIDIPADPHKDETDGELALEQALARSPSTITILGGHGGRTAMFLANLKLLRRAHDYCHASMVHGNETIRYGLAGEFVEVPAGILNLLAVSDDARVTVSGAGWSGTFDLPQTTARGVSNPVAESATVHVESGCVMVIHESESKKRPE